MLFDLLYEMTVYDAGLVSSDNVSRKKINRFGRGAWGCTPFLKREKEVSKLFLACMRSSHTGDVVRFVLDQWYIKVTTSDSLTR